MTSSFASRGGREMTPVDPGSPFPGRSLGASPGTSPSGSSAASTGHFRNHPSPIFTKEISGPQPRLQSCRAFGLEILCVPLLICRYLHVATCVLLLVCRYLCVAT
jgi:hypothetical protein